MENTTIEEDKFLAKVSDLGNITDDMMDIVRRLDKEMTKLMEKLEDANRNLRDAGLEEVVY